MTEKLVGCGRWLAIGVTASVVLCGWAKAREVFVSPGGKDDGPGTIDQPLATLAKAGLIDQERQGRETLCRAQFTRVDAMIAYLTENCCAGLEDAGDEDAA